MKQSVSLELTSDKEIEKLRQIVQPLLQWYWENARILPWRENKDSYRIWVSEIMLQQTRVEAVIPYYMRFLQALPDIPALANAREDVLLKLWEGLGYYSRVRNMQKAAQVLAEKYDSQLPKDYGELLKLPGIGEYTAGAIASIVYNIPVPAVDGNYYRVLSRLLASSADISQGKNKKMFCQIARSILPEESPGDFNQAVMDLGAMVCLPNTAPKCPLCPIQESCKGSRQGIAGALPIKPPKKPRRVEKRSIIIVFSGDTVLLHRRKSKGLLQGMWEFINLEGWLSEQQIKEHLQKLDLHTQHFEKLDKAKHIFSHVQWEMRGYRVTVESSAENAGYQWAAKNQLDTEYALPSAFKAYLKYVKEQLS